MILSVHTTLVFVRNVPISPKLPSLDVWSLSFPSSFLFHDWSHVISCVISQLISGTMLMSTFDTFSYWTLSRLLIVGASSWVVSSVKLSGKFCMTSWSVLLKALSIYHLSLLNVKKQHASGNDSLSLCHRASFSYSVSASWAVRWCVIRRVCVVLYCVALHCIVLYCRL